MELRLVEPATDGEGPRTDREKTTRGCFFMGVMDFYVFFLVGVLYGCLLEKTTSNKNAGKNAEINRISGYKA